MEEWGRHNLNGGNVILSATAAEQYTKAITRSRDSASASSINRLMARQNWKKKQKDIIIMRFILVRARTQTHIPCCSLMVMFSTIIGCISCFYHNYNATGDGSCLIVIVSIEIKADVRRWWFDAKLLVLADRISQATIEKELSEKLNGKIREWCWWRCVIRASS